MARYLVFDFETTGLGKDSKNGYKPYSATQSPLPRANFPVELSYSVVDEHGVVIDSAESILIRGATRFDPFVVENCAHLSVEQCDREGVEFAEALHRLAEAADGCTLVAHNIQYDWDEVIVATVLEQGTSDNADFKKLQACPRFCTCINDLNKANKSAYYYQKIGKWIGPRLEALATTHGVDYDSKLAHKASYDVEVTVGCLCKIMDLGSQPDRCGRHIAEPDDDGSGLAKKSKTAASLV
jgi:DNA polymerase III alpha subunit (gram-positive type)